MTILTPEFSPLTAAEKNHVKILIVAKVTRHLLVDTLKKKREFRYCNFCGPSGAKIVILSPIDFLFSLHINLNINYGLDKFEVDILKKCGQYSQNSHL